MEKTLFFDISIYASLIGAAVFVVHQVSHKPLWRWSAIVLLFASLASLTVFIAQRWAVAGYPPFSNTFVRVLQNF